MGPYISQPGVIAKFYVRATHRIGLFIRHTLTRKSRYRCQKEFEFPKIHTCPIFATHPDTATEHPRGHTVKTTIRIAKPGGIDGRCFWSNRGEDLREIGVGPNRSNIVVPKDSLSRATPSAQSCVALRKAFSRPGVVR